jgi:membrane protease YdiL (CAAX protease family)
VKTGWKSALLQLGVGWVIAAGILGGLAVVLHASGAYVTDPHPPKPGQWLAAVLIPAVAAPLVEESVFRGLLLGLWMRSVRPLVACLGTSLMFAFLHFLDPPKGFEIAHPENFFAGFQLLGSILFHFANPLFFVTDFATLFVVGLVLVWARLRTGALWFSIGLHSGWIVAFKSCNLLYMEVPQHTLRPWGVGDDLRSGLIPMLSLALTALICHSAMNWFEARRKAV